LTIGWNIPCVFLTLERDVTYVFLTLERDVTCVLSIKEKFEEALSCALLAMERIEKDLFTTLFGDLLERSRRE